jgi:hypothetical protein
VRDLLYARTVGREKETHQKTEAKTEGRRLFFTISAVYEEKEPQFFKLLRLLRKTHRQPASPQQIKAEKHITHVVSLKNRMENYFSILFLFLLIIPGCHYMTFTGIFTFPAPRNLRADL